MILLENFLRTNVHLGHSVKKYNPKMLPYIYSEKNGIYIIDMLQTFICLQNISKYLSVNSSEKRD